jgi:hypothetical protein
LEEIIIPKGKLRGSGKTAWVGILYTHREGHDGSIAGFEINVKGPGANLCEFF